MIRKITARLLAPAVLTAALVTAAPATAHAENVTLFASHNGVISTLGDNLLCTFNIQVWLESAGPGHVRAHYVPHAFGGITPCGATVRAEFATLHFPFGANIPAYVGSNTGEVVVDLFTGSGPNLIEFETWPLPNRWVDFTVFVP